MDGQIQRKQLMYQNLF